MNKKQAIKLIENLSENWIYASETGGDLHCYFCGEFQVRTDSNKHLEDCPYILAKKFLAHHAVDQL